MTFKELFRKWGLNSIKLKVGFAEVEFGPTEDDQTAAWDMYVELITRITTQPLDDATGDEETALNSVYQLFPITRDILKSKGRNAENFTKIAVIVLNQIIRPFTAKWHKASVKAIEILVTNINEHSEMVNEIMEDTDYENWTKKEEEHYTGVFYYDLHRTVEETIEEMEEA